MPFGRGELYEILNNATEQWSFRTIATWRSIRHGQVAQSIWADGQRTDKGDFHAQSYRLFQNWLANDHTDEDRGATMVEYTLIVSLIALVAAVGVATFGGKLSAFFDALNPAG